MPTKTTQADALNAIHAAFAPQTPQQRADDPDANWREQLTVAERIQDDAEDGKVCLADVKRLAELVTTLRDNVSSGGRPPEDWFRGAPPEAWGDAAKAPHECKHSDCACDDDDEVIYRTHGSDYYDGNDREDFARGT